MFLAASRKKSRDMPSAEEQPLNPFMAQVVEGTDPAGPGVGVPKAGLFTTAPARRRRWAAQVLGDTPQRDGPFAPAAQGAAVNFPPKARQGQRRKAAGLNPFDRPA